MHKSLSTAILALSLVGAGAAAAAQADPATPEASAQKQGQALSFALPHGAKVNGIRIAELSGLAWDADEKLLYAVSDQGNLFHFRVQLEGNRILDIKPVQAERLTAATKDHSVDKRFNAEGLALENSANGKRGDTKLVVALESKPPRIARFNPSGQLLDELPVPGPAADMDNYRKKGRGLESLALHPEHGVLTAPESPLMDTPEDEHTLYGTDGHWSFERHDPDSRLKGLAVLPGGDLLVLERSKGEAKKSRVASVRRIELASCASGSVCATETLAVSSDSRDNFEGVTLLGDHQALLVSDNGDKDDPDTKFVLISVP